MMSYSRPRLVWLTGVLCAAGCDSSPYAGTFSGTSTLGDTSNGTLTTTSGVPTTVIIRSLQAGQIEVSVQSLSFTCRVTMRVSDGGAPAFVSAQSCRYANDPLVVESATLERPANQALVVIRGSQTASSDGQVHVLVASTVAAR